MAEATTRSDLVYDRVRSDLLRGAIEPGSTLRFDKLRETYEASMGVLREALARLSAEGLVSRQAQQGFRALELSMKDLTDLTEARCEIEGLVLAESIGRGDLEWEARVVAAHHRMERTPKEDPETGDLVTPAWEAAHNAFHFALCDAAQNKRLLDIMASLRVASEIYRRWSIPLENPKRDVPAEHRELLDLSIARETDAAVASLRRHLELTKNVILKSSEPA